MKVFISWSKNISLQYASKTKEFIEKLDGNIQGFISELDISAGEEVQSKIINEIKECDKLIICFTKENKKSPWLLFEAGYAKGMGKTVIPILFDRDSNWHSWIDNPMNIAKEISFYSKNIEEQILEGLEIKHCPKNIELTKEYINDIKNLKSKNTLIDPYCEDFVETLLSSDSFVLENPVFLNKEAHFFTGFESYDMYKAIENSFLYTGKHLWIYGRKNMKLFSGNFKDFFKYLDEKSIYDDSMSGIDFRCLFLNPNSEFIEESHPQQDIFRSELISTIKRAKYVIGNNKNLEKCFRMYSNKREVIIIRIDNSIIYSRPNFNSKGIPELLTNTPFEVFSVKSERGQECIKIFEDVWHASKEMSYEF